MSIERIKTLIIGSGPAGYTAAIYASRADLNPVLYTGMEPGGQLTTTTEVDNFPGYPDGVDGPTMMVELQKQAERFGTDVRIGMVTEVKLNNEFGGIHKVKVDNSKEIEAETIIISTGATAKYLGIPSEERLKGEEFLHVQYVMVSFIKDKMWLLLGEEILLLKKQHIYLIFVQR